MAISDSSSQHVFTVKTRAEHASIEKVPTTHRPFELFLVSTIVFLSPMNYLRTELFYFTLSDVLTALAFVFLLATKRLMTVPFGKDSVSWYLGVSLLVLGLTIGSIVKGEALDGATVVAQYIFSFAILPMVLVGRPRTELVFLIKVFVFSMAIVMLHGTYFAIYEPADIRFVSGSGRMYGLIQRENATGAMGAFALVMAQWLYMSRHISGIGFLILVAPIAYGILLTGSNTGFFLAGVGVLTLGLFSGSVRFLAAAVGLGIFAVTVILLWGEFFLPEIFIKRVYGAIISGDSSQAGTFDDRIALNRDALQIARGTVFIGLGGDQFRDVSPMGAPVHNTYLLLLSEGGLMSLVGLVFMIITGLFIGWQAYQGKDYMAGGLTVTFLFLFALTLNGFAHVYARFWTIPLFLAISVSVTGSNLQGNSSRARTD